MCVAVVGLLGLTSCGQGEQAAAPAPAASATQAVEPTTSPATTSVASSPEMTLDPEEAAAAEHGTPVGLTALPERVRDARDGWPAVPELVGATAAADMLKVSRQQVWNLIEGGSLPGQRVGRDWVIPAAAVRALVEKRSAGA